MNIDLHSLPKFRDGWSYLYVEHCRVEQEAKAVALYDLEGVTSVPCSSVAVMMLGPGTTITHAAVKALAENGCQLVWCGEGGVRLYAHGLGKTRRSANLLHQAAMYADEERRLRVVRRMYQIRFFEELSEETTLQQIRGMEGARIRDTYARLSRQTRVPWSGRRYNTRDWGGADPINRALSAANACLYGVCHAGIIAAGFSPAIGFIHTGRMTSFVYDVADLYKTETSIPAAFVTTAEDEHQVERRVRYTLRDFFNQTRILERVVRDIEYVLFLKQDKRDDDPDGSVPTPGRLWDPRGDVESAINYDREEEA